MEVLTYKNGTDIDIVYRKIRVEEEKHE